MGMIDHYQPDPLPDCPRCGKSIADWQSKDVHCGLFLWKQGSAAPTDQLVDSECRLTDVELSEKRLSDKFEIYAYVDDCDCGGFTADCSCTDGVWSTCKLRSD